MTTAEISASTNTAVTAAHDLANTIFNALPESGRLRWESLALSGAEVAFTIKWTADHRCEVRLGIVTGDSLPETVFAVDAAGITPGLH